MLEILDKLTRQEMLEASETIFGRKNTLYLRVKKSEIRSAIIDWLKDRKLSSDGTETRSIKVLDRWVLKRVARKLKLEISGKSPGQIEDMISVKIMERLEERISKLKPEERKKLHKKLHGHIKGKFGSKKIIMGVGTGATAFVVAGQLSGFGIYLATTTGLKALSLLLGVTFSFSVYTTATTLLGVMLGPVGWIISGGALLAGVGKWAVERNWQRMTALTIYCIFKKNELKLMKKKIPNIA